MGCWGRSVREASGASVHRTRTAHKFSNDSRYRRPQRGGIGRDGYSFASREATAWKTREMHAGRWKNSERYLGLRGSFVSLCSERYSAVCELHPQGTRSNCWWWRNRRNLILSQVVEERHVDSSLFTENVPNHRITTQRSLSQALIPGSHLVKVEISRGIFDTQISSALNRDR